MLKKGFDSGIFVFNCQRCFLHFLLTSGQIALNRINVAYNGDAATTFGGTQHGPTNRNKGLFFKLI